MRWFRILSLVLVALPQANILLAQSKPARVAMGAGMLISDNGEDGSSLRTLGAAGFVRLGWKGSPLLLEGSVQFVPLTAAYETIPCPPYPASCGPEAFSGPTTSVTFAPALQGTKRQSPGAGVAWQFRIGPTLSWRMDREPGSDAFALGARAGMSARLGHHDHGFLVSADVIRLFRTGLTPRWYAPITLGWQF
ncbi:MAG: hypothetical protein V4558_13495 [Gemmatimonadota bacterium]